MLEIILLLGLLYLKLGLPKKIQFFPMWTMRVALYLVAAVTAFEGVRLFLSGWFGAGIFLVLIAIAEEEAGRTNKIGKSKRSTQKRRFDIVDFEILILDVILFISAIQFVATEMWVHAIWVGAYCVLILIAKFQFFFSKRA